MHDLIGNISPSVFADATRFVVAGGPVKRASSQPSVATNIQTKGQAIRVIDGLLSSFGMSGTCLSKLRRAKISKQLNLNGSSTAPVPKGARSSIEMLKRLRSNAHATNGQKQHFVQLWHSTREKHGARKALESLSGTAGFFKSMDNTQREVVAAKLGQLGSPAAVNRLKGAYANVIGNDFFHNASAKGKARALIQPMRSNKLVTRWKDHQVKLPFDVKTCKREALNYARRSSGYRTLTGQLDLAGKLLSVRDRVLFRFFEDMPTHAAYAGKSKSYADFYLDGHLKGSDWAQGAHDYLVRRGKQEACGLMPGRGNECIK